MQPASKSEAAHANYANPTSYVSPKIRYYQGKGLIASLIPQKFMAVSLKVLLYVVSSTSLIKHGKA